MDSMLAVRDLVMDYPLDRGVHRALKGIDLDVRPGEFFTLLGPSGCGKTTTLRSVAGLEVPTGGSIAIAGQTVFSAEGGRVVPANKRDISMVFQSYAIWPHMSVGENVAFPLKAMRQAGPQVRQRVALALEMVGLGDYLDRPATQLSGGQQQRVALARAIVKDAKLLLLDEPLSNLDAKLREQMRVELRDLQSRLGTTTLYVTHDQEEALSLSDRIAVMKDGEVVELGTPQELYLRPRHRFTAQFIGQAQVFPCTPLGANGAGYRVDTPLGQLTAGVNADQGDRASHLVIRPEHIQVEPAAPGEATSGDNIVAGEVVAVSFSGKLVEYRIRAAGTELLVQNLSTSLIQAGDAVSLRIPVERCVLLGG
ncbi:MAG: ABC transporter ATP-binding protein [Azospirillaceae bacterium]